MAGDKGNRTEQLNLRLRVDIVERLTDLADQYDFRGKNTVAQDIIEKYIEDWIELQETILNVRQQQRQRNRADATAPVPLKRTGTDNR